MTKRNRRPSERGHRSRSRHRSFEHHNTRYALIAFVALTLVVSFLYYGAPTALGRVVVHTLLITGLGVALAAPEQAYEDRGLLKTLFAAWAIVFGAQITGLIPLPAVIGRLISPHWDFDRPSNPNWDWASIHPQGTLEAMTTTAFVFGMAALVALVVRRRRRLTTIVRVSGIVVLAFALTIDALAPTLYRIAKAPPFIDSNHFGAALVVAYPAILGAAAARGTDWLARLGWGMAAAGIVAATLWYDTLGPFVVCVVVTALVLIRGRRLRLLMAGLSALTLFIVGLLVPMRGGISHGRFPIWLNSLSALKDHWLLGTGSGTYEHAVQPYRTDVEFHTWTHAHNDWLEWLVEGGVVGLIAMVAVIALLGRSGTQRTQLLDHDRLLRLCVLAFMLQGAFEFPFHLPFLAMAFAALWTTWRAAFYTYGPLRPALGKAVIGVALAANVAGLLFQGRQALVEYELTRLASEDTRSDAMQVLARIAPNAAERMLEQSKDAYGVGDRSRAVAILEAMETRYSRRPPVLNAVAQMARFAGEQELSERAANRSREWNPSDERNWITWAQITSHYHPERTLEVWKATLERGFHVEELAWRALPEGLVWATNLENLPLEHRLLMARRILEHDASAAIIAYQGVRLEYPHQFPVEYLEALVRTRRYDEAHAYWKQMPTTVRTKPKALAARARLAVKTGDLETAYEAETALWEARADLKARSRSLQRLSDMGQSQRLVDRALALRREEGRLTQLEVILLADAHRKLGQSAACSAELITQDFSRSPAKLRQRARRLQSRCGRPDLGDGKESEDGQDASDGQDEIEARRP